MFNLIITYKILTSFNLFILYILEKLIVKLYIAKLKLYIILILFYYKELLNKLI